MAQHDGDLAARQAARRTPVRQYSVVALWHLLSLDAPSVAALWTVFLARGFHVALPWAAPAALAVAVWMLYAADRLADASAGNAHEERHRFHQRHRFAFAAVWLLCAPLLLWLITLLPRELRDGWLLLAVPLAAYVGVVHAIRAGSVPKEPLIAVFFGTAAAMPALGSGASAAGVALAAVLFALACWLNCAAIAAWETPWSGYLDPATRWAGRHFELCAAASLLLCLALAAVPGPAKDAAAAACCSAAALLLLQQTRHRLHRTHVRALADAALLTPLLLLAWRAL